MIHLIAMQIRAAAPARSGDALGQHLQHRVEIVRGSDRDTATRAAPARTDRLRRTPRRPQPRRSAAPECPAAREGISSRSSSPARIARTSAAHSIRSSRVVAKKRPLGSAPTQWPARPTRCSPTRNRPRRTDLAHQIHRADIDAQLQRSGRHHHAQLAVLELLLGFQAQRPGKTAVMRQHRVAPQPSRPGDAPRARTACAC